MENGTYFRFVQRLDLWKRPGGDDRFFGEWTAVFLFFGLNLGQVPAVGDRISAMRHGTVDTCWIHFVSWNDGSSHCTSFFHVFYIVLIFQFFPFFQFFSFSVSQFFLFFSCLFVYDLVLYFFHFSSVIFSDFLNCFSFLQPDPRTDRALVLSNFGGPQMCTFGLPCGCWDSGFPTRKNVFFFFGSYIFLSPPKLPHEG